ncbi:hypothetical protein COT97_03925 [Candidatus Falkowbacteria bacterium CG10_big_fil_rev_8_21_14_0_10_39_11]|uniref:Uncharacterized protein n=1 Tax=Candidatus Falkowbacteria bacterium CG10_big_fil_rev_8_21_14_0_10_39_11 TaxID=1974565 RepID=A0A2H0V6H5_9BACT|nr:MAG: hypothetical protein COT97_03925 [Candidatus Falkowbacteria bacterium CG10_big_fil_rev_8_21_14_0_10_39_11]
MHNPDVARSLQRLEEECKTAVKKAVGETVPFENDYGEGEFYWKVLYLSCLTNNCLPADIAKRELAPEDRNDVYDFCLAVTKNIIKDNPNPDLKDDEMKAGATKWMAHYMLAVYEKLGLNAIDIYRLYGDGQSDEVLTPN